LNSSVVKWSIKAVNKSFIVLISAVMLFVLSSLWQLVSRVEQHTLPQINPSISTIYRYIIDEQNQFSVNDVELIESNFKDIAANKIPYDLGEQSYWINIVVENKENNEQSLVLLADNSLLAHFNVYKKNQPLSAYKPLINQTLQSTSNTLTHSNLKQTFPHINFILKAKKSIELLVHVKSIGPPNIPISFFIKKNFDQRTDDVQIIFGLFIGVLALMMAYNLVLYFAINDKVYLFYIGYLITSFIVIAALTGYGNLLFPNEVQNWLRKYLLFFHYFLVIFLLLFSLHFLRYEQTKGKIYTLGIISSIVLFIVACFSLGLSQVIQAKLFFSIQPFFYLLSLFIIFRRLTKDFAWARFYFISWIPLLIGSAIQPLVLLNHMESTFITRNAFLFAIIIEVTFMAFALAERMRRNENDRLKDISYHALTGLPRKSTLENTMSNLSSVGSEKYSVIVIKPEHIEKIALYIDDKTSAELFKRLNNRLSSLFAYNDAVISLTPKNEKLCLLDSNCFAFILNSKSNQQDLKIIIQSIQQLVSESFQIGELSLPLSAAIGIANYPEHGSANYLLINHAILAAKKARNKQGLWAYYQNESSDHTSYLLTLAADLKHALEHDELEIFHQPQIDLKTLRVCSSECLIRWHHKTQGFISPVVFIPLAEDLGLIKQVTLWVIKRSLSQHKQITEDKIFNHMVSINISGKDIASETFFEKVKVIIDNSEIPAEKIIFELTESASISHNQHSLDVIEQLTDLGITISIDDFGTGYSSMAQISHLPFQELKVDRQFVENVNDNHKRKVIAKSTVEMAKGLGLEVVAEGINSQEDEDTLRSFGCDIGQGYYYAKPMPISEYMSWLNKQDNGRTKKRIDLEGEFIPAEKSE
jgi:EAL domain-containing protein (putative c-di-GMP-specific phosphodiesterase class I)/GGDEF domain-containing protein